MARDPNTRAILATVAAMGLFVVSDAIMKGVGSRLPVTQALAMRAVVGSGLLAALIAARGDGVAVRAALTLPWVRARSLIDGVMTLTYVTTLVLLPLALVNAVTQAAPLLMIALAVPLLGERVGPRRWGAVAVGFAGVLIAGRPSAEGPGLGLGLALIGAALIAARDLLTRKHLRAVPALAVALGATLAVGVVAALAGALGLGGPWRVPEAGDLALLLASAAVVAAGNAAIIVAYRDGEVGAVAPFRYTVVPMAVVAGWAVFGEVPDGPTLLGAALVTAAGLYALRREAVAAGKG